MTQDFTQTLQSANSQQLQLPEPGQDAVQHSEQLINHIRHSIELHNGFLPFDEYMEQVLYAPGLGYYSAGSRKLGKDGDFITAPEISSLFSACLANAIQPAIEHRGGPPSLVVFGYFAFILNVSRKALACGFCGKNPGG